MADVIDFPKVATPTERLCEAMQDHPEIAALDVAGLRGFEKHLKWRRDCLHALELTGFEWQHDVNLQKYHEEELGRELAFLESSLRAVKARLEVLSGQCG